MKILAFTDIHENKIKIDQIIKKAKEVDLLICCGDFTWFGNDTEGVISKIAKTKKPWILLYGNHESPKEVEKIAKKYDNVIFLDDELYTFGDFQFFAHGGGGFSYRDKVLESKVKDLKKKLDKKKRLIFLTHAPPYGTKLDIMPFPGHVGCQSITKAILELQPILYMCGHIHECEGNKDKIGKTLALNPGRGKVIII
ncbi:MAG: metallophosphoesterase [Candidatus Nanoarchaeia archaeon]|nr:metallophosphoesterase [Candidatus Nanoarchaeia archaeon]